MAAPANPSAQPSTPTDPILVSIVDFVNTHHRKLWEIMEQKGGWEGWLQVELAFLITESSAHAYVAERELNVFKKAGQRVDIWATGAQGPVQSVGIELKCESHYQDNVGGARLNARLSEDVEKILAGVRQEYVGATGARVYAVGVTTNPNDLKGYDKVASRGVQMQYKQTESKQHWVLWWYKDF